MTNEELDHARATEAVRLRLLPGLHQHETVIAARLAREGWTPPEPVDPDLAEAEALWREGMTTIDFAFAGIKRGRALAAAEAKPTFFDALTANSALCRAEEMIRCAKTALDLPNKSEDAA